MTGRQCFQYFCLSTGGPPVKVQGRGVGPRSRSGSRSGGPQVKVWGPPLSGSRSDGPQVKVRVWGPPRSRSRGPLGQGASQGPGEPPGQGPSQGQGAPLVKVQVKVWGPHRSWYGSRSGGLQVKVQGAPKVKVKVWGPLQVKVWGAPRSRSRAPKGQGPGQGLGGHPPVKGPKMRVARAVCLLQSRRRTVLFNIITKLIQKYF